MNINTNMNMNINTNMNMNNNINNNINNNVNTDTLVFDLSTSAGVSWFFQPEDGEFMPISVPDGGWRAQGWNCDAGLYRATLEIPKEAAGKAVRVRFDAVNFGAVVRVENREGSMVEIGRHLNGWMPFSVNFTGLVTPGQPIRMEVEVKGRKKYMRDGKYLIPQGGTWLDSLAEGIIRGIHLEVAPLCSIEDVFVRTYVLKDQLLIQARICNLGSEPVSAVIRQQISSWNGESWEYPVIEDAVFSIGASEERRVDLGAHTWGLGPDSYWWPNVPYREGYRAQLHVLTLTLVVDGQIVHKRSQRFGFREFSVSGNRYLLNGVRCNLRGDNQQEANFGTDAYGIYAGFTAPSASNPGWPQAVRNLMRANHNVLRIHQIPATPYMLDVCDELGFMIIGETPIRGSERMEDHTGGWDTMMASAKELAYRDRNHPCIVIWSAANEIWDDPSFAYALQGAIWEADHTRPVIVDGVGDFGPHIINMEHYRGGFGIVPVGGAQREDRPYGETECVWPNDNSWQGFAWMATSVRTRRLRNDADIRNYVLNNAWSNYVPGQKPELQHLEKVIKNIYPNRDEWWTKIRGEMTILPPLEDPWNHCLIRLMQKCFHPVAACDVEYDESNKTSDDQGNWPTVIPSLPSGSSVTRTIAVFNDEFSEEKVTLEWELRLGHAAGELHESGKMELSIQLGYHVLQPIHFTAPVQKGAAYLVLRTVKNKEIRYSDDLVRFEIV